MHPDVYNLIDKGETLDELIHGVQVALRYFQTVSLYIIIGLPGDTMSRSLYTYNEVKKLGRGIGVMNEPIVNYSLAVPYSGTKLKDWAIENARAMKDSHETYTRGSEAMNAGAAYETEDFSSKERLKVYKILQTKEFRYVSVSKIHRYLTPFLWLRDSILYDSSNIMSHLLFIYRRVLNELRGNIRNSSYKEYVEYDRIPDGTWWLDDNK